MVTVENVSAKTLDEDSTSAALDKANPPDSDGKSLMEEGADEVVKIVQTRVVETETTVVREVVTKVEKVESSGAEAEAGTRDVEMEDGDGNQSREVMDIDLGAEGNGKTDLKETDVTNDKQGEDVSLGDGKEPLPQNDLGKSKGSGEKSEFEENSDSLSRDMGIEEMSEGEEREDEGKDGGYGFAVGDFVWGKIKSHPWWPGMIYDPSDASEYAIKLKPADRLLVGYFGDSTFAWCYPYQLKPFEENFQVLSKASQSKHFVNALQDTLDVISRLVELKFAPEEYRVGLERPLAMNAGIKEEVFVPDNGIYKFSASEYDPSRLIATLHSLAQDFSALSILELAVLKGYLSAFYRAKGGYQLPFYYPPQPVPGLEDNTENGQTAAPGPSVDDWHSSPSQNVLQKCSDASDSKPLYKRKRKSIAEIMEGDVDVHVKDNDRDGTRSKKSTPSSGRTKRKGNDETDGHGISSLSSKKKNKTMPNEESNARDDSTAKIDQTMERIEVENNDNPVSAKKTMIRVLSIPNDDPEENGAGRGPPSRERKKSKYLSPPFTSPTSAQRKKDLESESLRVSSEVRLAERMTKAASSLVNGSSILKNGSQMKTSDDEGLTSDTLNSKTPKQYEKRVFDPTKVKASADEVLCELRSVALSPLGSTEKDTVSSAWEYLYEFRDSVYSDGSNQKGRTKSRTDTKRKTLEAEADTSSSEAKAQRRRTGKSEEKLGAPTLKQASGASVKATSGAALFLAFGPGSSLPTKDELIKTYSRFGQLNEEETNMFRNNYCARIVFLRHSDAEEALKECQKANPFKDSNVSFQLIHPLDTEGKTSKLLAGEVSSELIFIKEKLETVASMLGELDDKNFPELKPKMEDEMKGLLEKVTTMVGSSS